MFEFQRRVRRLVSGMLTRHTSPHLHRSPGTSLDWLPPVMDLSDWSGAKMADRSAGWYFDRN